MSQLLGWIEISHRVGVWWWSPLGSPDSYLVPDSAGGLVCSVCSHSSSSARRPTRMPTHLPHTSHIRYVSSVSAAGLTGHYCIIQLFSDAYIHTERWLTWLQPAATAGRLGWTGIGQNGRRWGHRAFCLPLKRRHLKEKKWHEKYQLWHYIILCRIMGTYNSIHNILNIICYLVPEVWSWPGVGGLVISNSTVPVSMSRILNLVKSIMWTFSSGEQR